MLSCFVNVFVVFLSDYFQLSCWLLSELIHKPLPFLEQSREHDPREDRRQTLVMEFLPVHYQIIIQCICGFMPCQLVRRLRNHLIQRKMGNVTASPDKQDKCGKLAQDYASAQVWLEPPISVIFVPHWSIAI